MTMNYILNGPKCLIYLDTSESYILYLANEFIYNEDKIFVIFNHGFWTSTRNVKRNLRQKKKKNRTVSFIVQLRKKKLNYSTKAEHISEYDLNIPQGNGGFWLDKNKLFAKQVVVI